MEKTLQLDQRDLTFLAQLDQERTQALAVIGALSLDMKQAEKNLDNAAERQRSFIRQTLIAKGVERYDSARVQNGALIVSMPDEISIGGPPPSAIPPGSETRLNGPAALKE